MSENGASKNEQLFHRFTRLIGLARPRTRVKLPEPPQSDPEADLAKAVSEWAGKIPAEFTNFLNEAIEQAHASAEMAVLEHAGVAFHVGYEAALRNIRTRFDYWSRGQAVNAAPQGE